MYARMPVEAAVKGGMQLFREKRGIARGLNGVSGLVRILLMEASQGQIGEMRGAGQGKRHGAVGGALDQLSFRRMQSEHYNKNGQHVVFDGSAVFR